MVSVGLDSSLGLENDMKRLALCLLLLAGITSAEVRYLWRSTVLTGVNDNDVLLEMTTATHTAVDQCDAWQLGSTAGAIDVFVSLDGTNYLTGAVALTDLSSTTPSIAVIVTTAGGNYGFRGHFKKIKFLQNGATAVANGNVTCSQM